MLYLGLVILIALVFVYPSWRAFRREEAHSRELLAAAEASGRTEPASIRPYVDPTRCMGSGACVRACPEKDILKVIDGRAVPVDCASCVGHGACAVACPTKAIELRFGSEKRGIDIPVVDDQYESNVPGLFIAGELGGMGLIANAVKQGVQAVDAISRDLTPSESGDVDLIIVGAGPAGIAASLEATIRGIRHAVLEQDALGGSILHYPRKKIVTSQGFQLPGRERVKPGMISKEELVEMLMTATREARLPVLEGRRVESITKDPDGRFTVRTTVGAVRPQRVLLSVGRRGSPRTLGKPGEDLQKVAYRLLDAEQIHHAHVLVVGGGDSAVEAACSLGESTGNRVTLAYRGKSINRPKPSNMKKLETAVGAGHVTLALETDVAEILPDRVRLSTKDGEKVLPNDLVYVFAGGVLPWDFLTAVGLSVERHFGGRVEQMKGKERPS